MFFVLMSTGISLSCRAVASAKMAEEHEKEVERGMIGSELFHRTIERQS